MGAHNVLGWMQNAAATGGTVTQLTNKSTGVTINRSVGAITMNNASLTGGLEVAFTVTNNTVQATDVIAVCIRSGQAASINNMVSVGAVANGSFDIVVTNLTGGALTEALVINFMVL